MFLRSSCLTQAHTQSRCQPILTLPAATNSIWISATDDAQEPLVTLPVELGRHSHLSSSMEPVTVLRALLLPLQLGTL